MRIDPNIFREEHIRDLAARSGEPILDEQANNEARAALSSVLELVKFHGSESWDIDKMPGIAYQVLIEASARLYMNLGGFVQERADAVSLTRLDDYARGASLTADEISRLERVAGRDAGRGTLRSIPVSRETPVMRSGLGGPVWFRPAGPHNSGNAPGIPAMPGDDLSQTWAAYWRRY